MNPDPLRSGPWPLKSWEPGASARGDGKTLTIQLALPTVRSLSEPMSGRASANEESASGADLLHACVVPSPGQPLTITF